MTRGLEHPADAAGVPAALGGGLPGQDGDRLRRPPAHLRRVRRGGHPGGARAARLRDRAAATGWPTCCPTSRRCWWRTSRCRWPGAVLVAINTRLSTEEVRYILDHSGAKLLVVDAALYPTVAPVARRAEDRRGDHHGGRPGRARATAPAAASPTTTCWPAATTSRCRGRSPTRTACISINYTSGTTGQAQGRAVLAPRRVPELVRRGRALRAHASTASTCGRCRCSTATAGARRGRSPRSAAPTSACARCAATSIWRLIREHGVTHLNGAPTVVTTILRAPEAARAGRPITITTAGAPPSRPRSGRRSGWASGSCTSTGSPRPTGRTR